MNKPSSLLTLAVIAALLVAPRAALAQAAEVAPGPLGPAPAPSASALPGPAPTIPAPTTPAREGGISEQAAIERAIAKNPTLHVALLQAAQADADVRAEEGLYSAVASANAGFTHTRTPGPLGISTADTFDVGAGIVKPFSFGTVLGASVGGTRTTGSGIEGYGVVGQLTLTQPFLRGAGNAVGLASLRQARLRSQANAQAADGAASALLNDLLRAYWELWYAERVIGINEASRALAAEQARQAEAQVKSGAIAQIDSLVYQTRSAELDEAVVVATTERKQRSLALAVLLADSDASSSEIAAADSPPELAPGAPDALAVLADAERASPELRELQARIRITQDQETIAGDALRPRLDLDASVTVRGYDEQTLPPALEQTGRFEAVSAGVGLTFEAPIDGTRRRAQIASARFSRHVAEKQLEATRQNLRANVLSALSARDSAEKRVQVATETVRVARAQAEAERRRFTAGTSIAIQVQEAEDSLRQAELRLERARVDWTLSEVALAYLRGRLLERYRGVVARLPPLPPSLNAPPKTAL